MLKALSTKHTKKGYKSRDLWFSCISWRKNSFIPTIITTSKAIAPRFFHLDGLSIICKINLPPAANSGYFSRTRSSDLPSKQNLVAVLSKGIGLINIWHQSFLAILPFKTKKGISANKISTCSDLYKNIVE